MASVRASGQRKSKAAAFFGVALCGVLGSCHHGSSQAQVATAPTEPGDEDPDAAVADDRGVEIVLMTRRDTASEEATPFFEALDDPSREQTIAAWMENEAADLAFRLYAEAWQMSGRSGPPQYYVALEPGGNHARKGLTLLRHGQEEHMPEAPYILLDERPFRFEVTLLHETGHMVLTLLGAPRPEQMMSSYYLHTTPAITNRWTAFNEGFAIHLETVYAERAQNPDVRRRVDNRASDFSPEGPHLLAPLADLRTLSQSRQRFTAVRDNLFAHPGAYQGQDLLRHAIDPSRDLSRLRNGSQLLACEGFAATLFYRLVTAQSQGPALDDLDYEPLLRALGTVFQSTNEEHLWLIDTVTELAASSPSTWAVFLDLTRGATMSPELVDLWPQIYQSALRVQVEQYAELDVRARELRRGWLTELTDTPQAAGRAVGPEVWVCLTGVSVLPQYINEEQPVCVDLNAADLAELDAIPGATPPWRERVMAARSEGPFQSLADFLDRTDSDEALRQGLAPAGS